MDHKWVGVRSVPPAVAGGSSQQRHRYDPPATAGGTDLIADVDALLAIVLKLNPCSDARFLCLPVQVFGGEEIFDGDAEGLEQGNLVI